MSKNNQKTIGIIGGMGPLATADLFGKIVRLTRAGCDQEHLHILIDNDTDIPDRTAAILYGGRDPLPELCAAAERLEKAGADFLIMPCNTAHFYHAALSARTSLPVLNMLDETAKTLKAMGVRKAGLLATDGTIRSGVYERAMARQGIELLKPEAAGQKQVMHVIYDGIKAGNTALDASAFRAACSELLDTGAEILVLGCTELPPAFEQYGISLPNADPTAILAAAAIRYAGGELCGTQ